MEDCYGVVAKAFPSMNKAGVGSMSSLLLTLSQVICVCLGVEDGWGAMVKDEALNMRWVLRMLVPNLDDLSGARSVDELTHARGNFRALLDTVKRLSHKLHVNWVNVFPIILDSPESEALVSRTKRVMDRGFTDWDPMLVVPGGVIDDEVIDEMGAIQVSDMYDVISMDLYENVKSMKELMFEGAKPPAEDDPFLKTWYGRKFLKRGYVFDVDGDVTLKNVYNFAKSMVHDGPLYDRMPTRWEEMGAEARGVIIGRLNRSDTSWFNMGPNILTREPYADVDERRKTILDTIMRRLPEIVVESMIMGGCLSRVGVERSDEDEYTSRAFYYLTELNYSPSYFKRVKDLGWNTMTTFKWPSQVDLFHRFIHKRVSFITGATGAGKSTQAPKLYSYFITTVEKKRDNSVIVSVPRINIVVSVSARVSEEADVPQSEGHYFFQYKHMRGRHVARGAFPKILFVTDGSVLQGVGDMAKRADVLFIDEAHEHNVNMDLIISIGKQVVLLNRGFRLVVMSATMEQDEVRYDQHFRHVNDNLKTPYSEWLLKSGLDRGDVSRRVHICPPGFSTRFPIEEKVLPGADPVKLAIKTMSDKPKGDLLMFQPGVREIEDAVKKLNSPQGLPRDTVAIPYYSKLSNGHKELIRGIPGTKRMLRMRRGADFSLLDPDDIPAGAMKYDNVVIVSTNIAEASISIPSLAYVVDTGLEKSMFYDSATGISELKLGPISVSSMVQRRGRVGRVSPGVVFRTYAEPKESKLPQIATQDIKYSVVLQLLAPSGAAPSLAPPQGPPVVEGTILAYQGPTEAAPVPMGVGVPLSSILDVAGDFYVVHPGEAGITRDVDGNVVTIDKSRMEGFVSTLVDEGLADERGKTPLGTRMCSLRGSCLLKGWAAIKLLFYGIGLMDEDDFRTLSKALSLLDANLFDMRKVVKDIGLRDRRLVRNKSDLLALGRALRKDAAPSMWKSPPNELMDEIRRSMAGARAMVGSLGVGVWGMVHAAAFPKMVSMKMGRKRVYYHDRGREVHLKRSATVVDSIYLQGYVIGSSIDRRGMSVLTHISKKNLLEVDKVLDAIKRDSR